jgi:pyruvate dehydrogenase E2 component (dihydrolipoamide acetyltransferase)
MIVEVRLPEISENVHTGDVVKVLANAGDTVQEDQPLVELETEKAVFEVPSTAAGVLSEITVKAGDTINVGDVIARINTDATSASAGKKATAAEAPKEKADVEPGEKPAKSAAKPGDAPPARGSNAPVRQPAADEADGRDRDALHDTVVAVAEEQGAPVPASPTVRRLARELGIDIHRVKGSGAGGRITSEDVHQFAKAIITGSAGTAVSAAPAAARKLPDFARYGEFERTPMSKVRQLTAQNMAFAWNSVPHVTQHDQADITDLEAARKQYGPRVEKAGGKLTMTSILTKVCASALHRFPDFNASIDVARSEVIHKRYVNIGIAVDTERGLLVPVIRDVDRKNITELSAEVSEVAEKARNKRIMPDDLEGGNFTISNLGGIGGVGFTPIVNWPEVAILGVSRASMKPVYRDGEFTPRLVMPLSLSYDHRLIDGAAAARFLRWICEALENPILLSLEG